MLFISDGTHFAEYDFAGPPVDEHSVRARLEQSAATLGEL
jgi:hypothetical protein